MSIGILVEVLYNRGMSKLMWSISKLINWDKNPRAIKSDKFQELKERIKKYGQFKPVITTLDGEVIGGNMRLRAMKDLGIQEIWVSVVEPKTNAEKIEIALADNEEMGYYQEDQLAELISEYKNEIKLESFSIHLGDGVNLEDLLNKYQPEEIIEDEAPEVEEEFVSEVGAIYQLGNHRLMCGDSTNIEHVEMLMDGKKADMVFTDPPYGMNFQSNFRTKTKQFEKIANDDVILDISPILNIFLKNNSVAYICTRWDLYHLWFSQIEKYFNIKNCIVWYKKGGGLGDLENSYSPNHEFIIVAHKGTSKLIGKRDSDVWEIKRDSFNNYNHPTQKPIELSSFAITHHSTDNNLILDLFGGSGSTLIACEQTKRTCFMMELDPRYVDVIRKRYAKFIGKENEWQEVTPRIN